MSTPTDDEIEQALRQAAQQGLPTEIDFDALPAPGVPTSDDIQATLNEAKARGITAEVSFENLPAPKTQPAHAPTRPMPAPEPKIAPPPAEPLPPPQPAIIPPAPQTVISIEAASDFWLLLPIFIAFRLLTLFLLRPGGFIRDWSDFDTYFGIAALSDYQQYPFLNFWLEWPPILPWLSVGAYQLALWLPPWPEDPRLWFILILGSIFLLFEVGNFWLLHRLSQRLWANSPTANRVMWLYLGLFPPVYAMLGFFDCIALFFILLALDTLLNNRPTLSALSVGVGFMVKILPILMLPVAARRIWQQYRENGRAAATEITIYSLIVGLTIMGILAPFLLNGPQWVETSARSMLSRSSWETVWAVMEGYYGFGLVAGDRLNPAETNFAAHPSTLPWWLISLFFGGWYLLIFSAAADYEQERKLFAFCGLTVSTMLLYSKGYSPQFIVYLLPFIILLFPNERGLTYSLILTGLNVLEQPIYFVLIPSATWLLTFVVITRFVILLILTAEFWLIIWPQFQPESRLHWLHENLPAMVAGLSLVALFALTPLTIQAYSHQQRLNSPEATFVSFMRAQAQQAPNHTRLIVTNQATYRQVYPHLRGLVDVRLLGSPYSPPLSNALNGADSLWLLPADNPMNQQIASVGRLMAVYNFGTFGNASWYNLSRQTLPAQVSWARFTSGIELVAYQIEWGWNTAEITLFWQATSQQGTSYKVFTQMLNANGELLASHDGIPRDGTLPTTDWPLNVIQIDRHVITFPSNTPTQESTFITGLYNNVGERLTATAPNGQPYPNRAVPLIR